MHDQTGNNIIKFPLSIPSLYDPAILDNPDFVEGFKTGIEAFEAECEDKGRPLTALEVIQDIWDNVNPQRRAESESISHHMGMVTNPLFESGFLAGWLYAHWYTPAPASVRDTQPLSVVTLLRLRHKLS